MRKGKAIRESDGKSDDLSVAWKNIKQGDKKDFAALFESGSDRLYCYGIKLVNDKELVKDSIQELFIRLYQNRHKLPEVDNPIFYLFKSLRNIMIDAIREKDKLNCLSLEELPFNVRISWDDEADFGADDSVKEKFDMVIRLLSDRQKEAIYLRFEANMSYDEIARLLSINYQSARNLIHRSIEKIRSQMDLKLFVFLFISTVK
ncbi:MAG: sigma-70 family RNA polymerase sigma factor [Tannerellaceae bacterium]|jgi:RNA polymerase sigma-70 factor (ECF subfamily)|nr:sigma-70 family RNA polymerase sigma factor [Tannerellaceae bacterium]